MRKRMYVILTQSIDSADVAIERLKTLGDYYRHSSTCIFLSTTIDSAKSVFDSLVYGLQFDLIVVELKTEEQMNYWGFSNKEFWAWLKEKSCQ